MKIKLWQWEYDFDRSDAEIVIPLALLLLGLAFTPLNKPWLWGGAVAYYALYFFLKPSLNALKNQVLVPIGSWLFFRCPYCKSRDIFEQGLQEYHGDVPYYYHLCNHCGETSILLPNGRLIKAEVGVGAKELKSTE